ncbi:MAG: DnaB helicase C-terminal domain-containing protein [Deltaproteobacteria bacterium]|nr:DnaB helicase C-terminal domain-containing protein [Deltaproteobacteria bacterium]
MQLEKKDIGKLIDFNFRKLEALQNPAPAKILTPWESVLEEANRPDGISFPDSWNLKGITMRPSLLTILGAYSGIGKSTTMLNIIRHLFVKGKKALVFSHEMTPGQLWARFAGIDMSMEGRGSHTIYEIFEFAKKQDDYLKSLIEEASKYITVIDSTGWTAGQITAEFENYILENDEPDMVAIDYLQIIRPDMESVPKDKRLQVMSIMEELTGYAKKTSSVWLVVAQTNRDAAKREDGKAPSLTAFQESAAIEQNAGLAITLGRAVSDGDTLSNTMNIRIAKNRFGRTGASDVNLDPVTGAIEPPLRGLE